MWFLAFLIPSHLTETPQAKPCFSIGSIQFGVPNIESLNIYIYTYIYIYIYIYIDIDVYIATHIKYWIYKFNVIYVFP